MRPEHGSLLQVNFEPTLDASESFGITISAKAKINEIFEGMRVHPASDQISNLVRPRAISEEDCRQRCYNSCIVNSHPEKGILRRKLGFGCCRKDA